MTCCSGSSVSSAEETMKVASFSSSLIVGSALTSTSNCSSGTSARTFLPSGPTATASAWICSAVFVGLAFFAAAFLAGADLAVADFAGAFFAAVFLAVELAELEDTNTSRIVFQGLLRNLRGRDKTRRCQQPHVHCVMPPKARGPRPTASHARAAAFFSFLYARTLSREALSTTSATDR